MIILHCMDGWMDAAKMPNMYPCMHACITHLVPVVMAYCEEIMGSPPPVVARSLLTTQRYSGVPSMTV